MDVGSFNVPIEETVPVYQFRSDGKVQNVRPTIFHRRAVQQMQRAGTSGRVGYIVKNQYGVKWPMTFLQAQRMETLFSTGVLEVIDHWTVHHAPREFALTGFDTEMTGPPGANSSIMALPSSTD